MALAFQSNDPIKLAMHEELLNLLSSIKEIRVLAERRMKQLEITEGYGVFLAEMIMNQSFDLGLRQLASVMLKKYVEEHWNIADSDVNIIATELAKKTIRNILPNGLYDPNSKIRTSVAYTISIIASLDWPNAWTELFDIIVKCLGGNENSIHGAMQVLVEFTYDLDSQIKVVGPIIISEVYRIFEAEQTYNVETRTCAVKIFKSLFRSINAYIDDKEEQNKLLNPVLPSLMEKLTIALSNPNPNVNNFALITEVIKVLQYMVNEMPRYTRQFATQILPPVWQLLTQIADVYVKVVVNCVEPVLDDDEEEGELSDFTSMILQLIEFIHSIIEQKRFRTAIKNVLTDLIYIMIVYMQITEEQLESWADDSDKFVEDDFQGEIDDSIRIYSQDILDNLAPFDEEIFPALTEALARHLSVAEAEQLSGSPHWWKIHEASMVAVGFYRDIILKKENKFDISQYLNYVRNSMAHHHTASPYLLARCIWLLCRFANCDIYSVQTLGEILETILNSMQSDKPLNLRIYAARSIYELCYTLKQCSDERHNLVVSKLGGVLDGILALMNFVKSTVLSVLLETITAMASFDVNFTANHHSKLIPLTIAIFLRHKDDPFLLEHVQHLLKILSQNPYSSQPLQEKIIPTLVSIFNIQGNSTILPMQDTALDVLNTVVKHAKAPLSDQLIENAFPAAVHCILRSDDNSIMQSGGECLRAFLNVSPEQVCSYKNGEGLNYIMQVAIMLLNPMNTEFSASFAGRLVITIISKAGNMLGENTYLLLKAVISKMQLVNSLNVAMSLMMTFAHLFVTQMEAVLNFLSTVPGPTGEPAIQFVFSNWLSRQNLFYGDYERKIGTMALCKLFEHGVTTQDNRLTSITFRDLVEPKTELKRSTRSQSAAANSQQQWTTIPVLVKMFKLLINELAYQKESNINDNEYESDENSDDNSAEDEDFVKPKKEISPWGSLIDDIICDSNVMMEEFLQDPFFQSMEENLTKFFQNFSSNEHFREFAEHLTDLEKLILQGIQVSV